MVVNSLVKIDGIQITRDQLSELFPVLPRKQEDESEDDDYEERVYEEIMDFIHEWSAVLDDDNKIINEEGWFYDEVNSEIFYLKENMRGVLREHKESEIYKYYFNQEKIQKKKAMKCEMHRWSIKIIDNSILNLEGVRKIKNRIRLFTPPCCADGNLDKFFIGFVTSLNLETIFNKTPSMKSLDSTSKFDISHFKELFPKFTDPVTVDTYLSTDDCLFCS